MDNITSLANEKVKRVKKIRDDSRLRKSLNLLFIETTNLYDALPDGSVVEELYIDENCFDSLNSLLKDSLVIKKTYLVNDKITSSVSETINNQGFFALVQKPKIESKCEDFVIVLDRLRDPGNYGTILRSMTAFGLDKLYAVESCDFLSSKVVRSSMGGIFHVDIEDKTYDEVIDLLKDYYVISLDMNGKKITDIKGKNLKNKKIALVVGNEALGVSQKMIYRSDLVVSIEMTNKIESLNAAVALSIAMHDLTNKIKGV